MMAASKQRAKAPKPEHTPESPIITFDDAVREAKAILQQTSRHQWRLGELADQVRTHYGEGRLKAFAEAIGVAPCTLERYRDVHRAWREIPAPGRESLSYSVARELATHPDRAKIVADNPTITKREASKKMRALKMPAALSREASEVRRWIQQQQVRANDFIKAARFVEGEITPELQQAFREGVDPNALAPIRKAGQTLLDLANRLEQLIVEPPSDAPAEIAEPPKQLEAA